jgi:O-antigen ligase
MDYLKWMVIFSIPCLALPIKYLILLGVVGVALADSRIVPYEFVYYMRFMPMGVLCLRTLIDLKAKRMAWNNTFSMVKVWIPFLGFALFSVMYSLEPSLSIQRVLSAFFVLIGFGVGIPLYLPDSKRMLKVLFLLSLVLGAAVLYCLSLAGHESAVSTIEDYDRLYGIFRNPNTLGILCMQLFFLLIYLYQKGRDKVLGKIILGVMIAVGVALVASGSRASAVGLVAGLIVLMRGNSQTKRRNLLTVAMLILILVSIVLVAGYFLPSYSVGLFRTDTAGRSGLWQRAWDIYIENSFFGTGFGNGQLLFAADATYLRSIGIYVADPHNSFLQLLIELGFVGLGLAVFAFGIAILRGWRFHYYFEDPQLGVVLSAAIIGSLVDSLFETWLFGFGNAATVPFWLFLGMISQLTDRAAIRAKQMSAMVRYREAMLFSSARIQSGKRRGVKALKGWKDRKVVGTSTMH